MDQQVVKLFASTYILTYPRKTYIGIYSYIRKFLGLESNESNLYTLMANGKSTAKHK